MGATDVIKDFTVSQTDQFGVDLSDMEAQALTDFVGLDAVSVAADQAMNTLIVNATAAVDLNGTDTGKEIAVFSGDYADETGALLQADIRANLTVAGNFKLVMLSLVFTTMALTPSWLVLKQLAVVTMPCSMTLTLSSWRNSRVSRMQRLLSTQTSSPRLPDQLDHSPPPPLEGVFFCHFSYCDANTLATAACSQLIILSPSFGGDLFLPFFLDRCEA